jgi:hypothetical protein
MLGEGARAAALRKDGVRRGHAAASPDIEEADREAGRRLFNLLAGRSTPTSPLVGLLVGGQRAVALLLFPVAFEVPRRSIQR